ncbi:DUF3422 domain-containing protein [Sphingomonas qomolangmaensis]|uniref:DUF3422 domain-containing protein n=1 Tax=Sphingomonas qomolangmaensis TaxID=2918765 RepID=A0ABY5LA94_9SPHN|nr:DUF3422 domain-containing protein [Sphingomonas qomolangmaensis]UUL83061.1 DUF3422 domain-containing protein [Sphingomonas qomolangmaensis]
MHDLSNRSHPLRASLSAEMHVRRLPRFASPCRLLQVVTLLGDAAARESRAYIEDIATAHGQTIATASRYAVLPIGPFTLVWEGHTEFASFTLILAGAFADPFDTGVFDGEAASILIGLPGQVIRATQIAVLRHPAGMPPRETLATWFDPSAIVVCDVAEGNARIASDFMLHPDGFGRLLIDDISLEGDEAAQLVVRLQELGNYRNMALLGLPMAQQLTPEVTAIEARLSALTHEVSERSTNDDALLDELTSVAAELARLVATTRYRMSATRAYAELSMERLRSLGIGAVRGFQTLADFTERRLVPAVRTCASFSNRLEDLSQRTAWTSSLLRTRIDIALAKQNRDLLESMDRRTQLQLRLQQAVEGLSVVAISYYLVSLIGYLAYPAGAEAKPYIVAGAVPVVMLAVWWMARRLRKGFAE